MKNKRVAVFANGWSNEFLGYVLEGIREEAKKDNVDIFVYLTYILHGEMELQSKCQLNIMHLPNPSDYDGAIMLTNTFNLDDEQERVRALFQRAGVPMISTEVKVPGMAVVGTGNYQGVYNMATHLIEVHNVKRVIYVSGIKGNRECAIRKKALMDALADHGLELMDTLDGDFGFFRGKMLCAEYLNEGKPLPDAFVCANDLMALGLSNELYSRGIDVPKDVIVTGFDHVKEASSTFPLLATVSRNWDKLGNLAYKELKSQMQHQDADVERWLDSSFLPSESCGCTPSPESTAKRLDILRNSYFEQVNHDIMDIFFQRLRIETSKSDSIEAFNEAATKVFNDYGSVGNDFAICVEPDFFELEDEEMPKRIRGYSDVMKVIFSKSKGVAEKPYSFYTSEVVPKYHKEENESNMYIITPLNNMENIIGYLCIKNSPSMIYDLSLRKWMLNMNTLFLNMRQYIFSQRLNKKLKEIYMTDFLTGMFNRTGCEKELFSFIEKEKAEGRTTILLFADIDCMKTINDVYGHLNGDLAIKATADAMRKSLPNDWLFGRYGGDEFVAVGPCTNTEVIVKQRANLANSIKALIESFNLSFELSVSVGYTAIRPHDEGTIEDFIRCADESMYEAKQLAHERIRAGRNKLN